MKIPLWLGKLMCPYIGHQRGKRLSATADAVTFRCPRCGATWTRKGARPRVEEKA